MIRTRNVRYRPRRRGVILLVVLTMLTLFALVGISFVLVAGSQETSARIAREAETLFKPGVDPEASLAFFLGKLLYDDKDDIHGARSAMRGQSLGRNMYGWWDGSNPGQPQSQALNDKPFTGTGRLYADQASGLHHTFFNNPGGGVYWPPACQSDSFIMNYQYHQADGFVRDPERLGSRTQPSDAVSRWAGSAFNVPYTYPDHNNFYLAQVDPNDGLILVPSFHREYLFGRLDLPPDPPAGVPRQEQVNCNSNWRDPQAKYLTLRPTLAHHPDFPLPVDRWGDVKNLDGAPGGADSIWIDIGSPVMVAPQIRSTKDPLKPMRYKMLVAPLVLELDSRVNLNVVGNWLGQNATDNNIREHRSNQGWGMWEVNPSKVLNWTGSGRPAPEEWLNMFLGSEGAGSARIRGRHDNVPTNPAGDPARTPKGQRLFGGQGPRVWAQVDYDAMRVNDTGADANRRLMASPIRKNSTTTTDMPAGSWVLGLPIFPGAMLTPPAGTDLDKTYLNGGYGNNMMMGTPENNTDHPTVFNVARPTAPNRKYPVKDMAQLLRFGGSGSESLGSELLRLMPQNLVKDGGALRRRNLITLLSADLDRPGVVPYIWKPDANENPPPGPPASDPNNPADDATRLRLRQDSSASTGFPTITPAPTNWGIPSLAWDTPAGTPMTGNAPIPFPGLNLRPNTPNGEFDGRTWRSTLGDRGRLDLGRAALYPYPSQLEINNDPAPKTVTTEKIRKATVSRQALAGDIFETLRRSTGAMPTDTAYTWPGGTGTGRSEEFSAIRYLAQLAVNLVDYIDTDDVSTPFAIPGLTGAAAHSEWVFGFELPRLVLNEVYAAYDNDLASMNAGGTAVDPTAGKYAINVWAELMNPLPEDRITSRDATEPRPFAPDGIAELYYEDTTDTTGAMDYSIYRMLLTEATAAPILRDPANSTGNPDFDMPAMTRIHGVIGRTITPPVAGTPPYSNWTTARDMGIRYVRPLPETNRFNDQGPGNPVAGLKEKLGFMVVGAKTRAAGGDEPGRFDWVTAMDDEPTFQNVTLTAPDMTWGGHNDASMMLAAMFDGLPEADRPRPMVVLQRLANPRRPFNDVKQITDPTDPAGTRQIPNPNYNPYVTIDYHECHLGQVEYGRRFDTMGNAPTPAAKLRNERASWGRNQPLAAFSSPLNPAPPGVPDLTNASRKPQAPNAMLPATEPKHTFLRQNSVESDITMFPTQVADPLGTPPAPSPPLPNGSLKKPSDWLVHLDRAPISAGELLHVSALRPYDVLQYFVVRDEVAPAVTVQRHKAPWLDPRSRLYRFLEFVSAVNDPYRFDTQRDPQDPPPSPPPPAIDPPGYWGRPNARVQGKINLNMVMTPEQLYAMADPQTGNSFNQADIDALYNAMLVEYWPQTPPIAMRPPPTARTPKVDLGGSIGWRAMAGPTDRRLIGNQFSPLWNNVAEGLNKPLWGLAMGHSSYATGTVPTNDPLMAEDIRGFPQSPLRRPLPTDPLTTPLMIDNNNTGRAFPDYQSKEILTKLFNNFTTRSNVFAVWVTVGFFEVTDEAANPVRLGAEVGKVENRHVRYRTFAIVDRSQMTAFSASSQGGFIKADQFTRTIDTGRPATDQQAPGVEIQLNWSRTVPPQPLPPTPLITPPPPAANSTTKQYFVKDGRTGREWEVTDGTILVFDPKGDNEEAVVVKSYIWTDPANTMIQDRRLYANFMRSHGSGAPVICHGNPGPMERYNPRTDTDVVPYFQLLD